MFGLTDNMVKRQLKVADIEPDYKAGPISRGDTFLEHCIQGAKKIQNNPDEKEMIREILTNTLK